jgi:hypothetical protein
MDLREVAELSWSKIFPQGANNTAVSKEEFIRTAYSQFAFFTLQMAWKDRAEDYYEVPSYLLTEVEKEIANNEMDISDLKYFKSLPIETWLVNIGGIGCHCKYVKSTLNLSQLLCEDDSLDDATRTYFLLGKKIVFPKGTHKSPLKIIYANMGAGVDGSIECDESVASLILDKLDFLYLGKVAKADTSNNNNPND